MVYHSQREKKMTFIGVLQVVLLGVALFCFGKAAQSHSDSKE